MRTHRQRALLFLSIFLCLFGTIYTSPIPSTSFVSSETTDPETDPDSLTSDASEGDSDDDETVHAEEKNQFVALLEYICIPIMSALIGWGTNVIALKMTFYPLEWWGVPWKYTCGFPLIGWQGIIPMKAGKMAGTAVDLLTEKLIDITEVFGRLDPVKVAELMEPNILEMIRTLLDEIAMEVIPGVWKILPEKAKQEIYSKASEEAPRHIAHLMAEVRNNIKEVFDLRRMVVDALVRDKELLNQIFIQCGGKELKFIEMSGFWLGGLFGIFQALAWFFYKGVWVLPTAGFIVGYATNEIALRVIFEPVVPKKIGPWTLQGLFIKRQKEVSELYGKVVATEVLHAKVIMMAIIRGPASDKLFEMLYDTVSAYVDATAGAAKPILHVAIPQSDFEEIKSHVCARLFEELPHALDNVYFYADQTLDIERTLVEKMSQLPAEDFESALHPVFQEDEWKLILVGGILGALVGLFQLLVIFA